MYIMSNIRKWRKPAFSWTLWSSSTAGSFLVTLLLVVFLSTHAVASAQSIPAGLTMGMTEAELKSVVPGLERVRRPSRAPNGATGLWRQPNVAIDSWLVDQTFYLDAQGLKQIEWLVLPRDGQDSSSSFSGLVAGLRQQYGAELAARQSTPGLVQESASWVAGDMDVIASRSGSPDQPTVRMIWRQRVTKDASEL